MKREAFARVLLKLAALGGIAMFTIALTGCDCDCDCCCTFDNGTGEPVSEESCFGEDDRNMNGTKNDECAEDCELKSNGGCCRVNSCPAGPFC